MTVEELARLVRAEQRLRKEYLEHGGPERAATWRTALVTLDRALELALCPPKPDLFDDPNAG